VSSPYVGKDIHTGGSREIDVGIVDIVGTTPVLIAVECRDRRKTQDVTWIEQLVTKCTSIGASVIIAVSKTPFSAEAQAKAAIYGVKLRRMESLTAEDIRGWMAISSFHEIKRQLEPVSVRVAVVKEGIFGPTPIPIHSKVFIFRPTNTRLSLLECLKQTVDNNTTSIFGTPSGPTPPETKTITIAVPPETLFMEHDGTELSVREIVAEFRVWHEVVEHPLVFAARYSDSDGVIAEVAEFPFPFGPTPLGTRIQFVKKGAAGGMSLAIVTRPAST